MNSRRGFWIGAALLWAAGLVGIYSQFKIRENLYYPLLFSLIVWFWVGPITLLVVFSRKKPAKDR